MKKIAATMVKLQTQTYWQLNSLSLFFQEGLLQVGLVKDNELCKDISDNYKNHPLVFWQIDDKKIPQVHVIEGSDYKEIVDKILNILPHPPVLDEIKFHVSIYLNSPYNLYIDSVLGFEDETESGIR